MTGFVVLLSKKRFGVCASLVLNHCLVVLRIRPARFRPPLFICNCFYCFSNFMVLSELGFDGAPRVTSCSPLFEKIILNFISIFN